MQAELKNSDRGIYSVDTGGDPVIAVAAKSSNPVDYRQPHDRARSEEKRFLAGITSLDRKNIIFLNQVHGGRILVFDTPPDKDYDAAGDADAMITDIPGLCLVIRTADCVPVFLHDRENSVLGAVHSGWKGTRLEIVRNTLRLMGVRFGSKPRNVAAYLLPSIGPESYRVNSDVFDLFTSGKIEQAGDLFLDLWENIELSLFDEGVPEENIINPRICSLKENREFFSHRGGDEGRNLNFGYMVDAAEPGTDTPDR